MTELVSGNVSDDRGCISHNYKVVYDVVSSVMMPLVSYDVTRQLRRQSSVMTSLIGMTSEIEKRFSHRARKSTESTWIARRESYDVISQL